MPRNEPEPPFVDDVLHLDAVDAGDRDEHADAVDGEHRQREQDPPAELRDLADICDRASHGGSLRGGLRLASVAMSSIEPPAASIFDFAVAEARCALIVSFLVSSPSPRILIVSTSFGMMPFARSVSRSTVAPASNSFSSSRHVDRERLDAVRVLEAALRNAARHRHLTTFEREARAVVTGAGLLALDALTGRLARTRAATAAEPLLGLGGARVRVEVVQRDRHGTFSRRRGIWRGITEEQLSRSVGTCRDGQVQSADSTVTRWLTLRIMPRIATGVLEDDRLVRTAKAEALEGLALGVGAADAALDLGDFELDRHDVPQTVRRACAR